MRFSKKADFATFYREQSQMQFGVDPSKEDIERRYRVYQKLTRKLGRDCEMKFVKNLDGSVGIDYKIA